MEDLTGKQLGKYQIIAPLGEGGMAAVYKAYQPGMDRNVALKILPRHFASDPQFVGRFHQEAKVIAKLQHVYILPVHDFGEDDGYTYIVMPYVETGTLAELLRGDPLPLEQIKKFITQIGEALSYAHNEKLVHRDVKPTNILIDESGNCLLTDFGIAKIVEGTTQFTQTGATIGTPAYMSPEQILGETLDGRSDIYSLGIILYELATGRPPYRAETPPAIFVKHLHDPLPPPRTINPDLTEALEKVILKCLAKDREDRFEDATEMVEALQRAVEEKPAVEVTKIEPEILPEVTVIEDVPETPEVEEEPAKPFPVLPEVPPIPLKEEPPIAIEEPPIAPEAKGFPRWVFGVGALVIVILIGGGLILSGLLSPEEEEVTPIPSETSLPTSEPTALPTVSVEVNAFNVAWVYDATATIGHLDSWGDGMATGDLNEDGIPDIAIGLKTGAIVVIDGTNGVELWSSPITSQTDAFVDVDVVDVDNDGKLDLIVGAKGDTSSQGRAMIIAFDQGGDRLWQATGDYEEVVDLAYGDVDVDGDLDIVAAVGTYPWGGGQVLLLDGATGTKGGSQQLGSGYPQGLDLLDVDGDGDLEVAVENYDNKVFLLDGSTGDILWSQSKSWYGRDVLISDVDGDGTPEILSGAGRVVAYDPSGAQKWMSGPEQEGMNISVGNISGDEKQEVILTSGFSGVSVALDGKGVTLWERERSGAHAVGDVNGDGQDEIVFATIRYWGLEPPYGIDVVDGQNNTLWSYPLDSVTNDQSFALATANLDADPAVEVLVANGQQLLLLDAIAKEDAVSLASPTPIPNSAYDFAFISIQNEEWKLFISSTENMDLAREIPKPEGYEVFRWPSWCGDQIYVEVADAERVEPQRIFILEPFLDRIQMWVPPRSGFGNLATPSCQAGGPFLAYAAFREGRYQVEVTDVLQEQVTFSTASETDVHFGNPSWSGGGERLFFMGFSNETYQLWGATDAGGSTFSQLTLERTGDGGKISDSLYPALSPDGRYIAFICEMGDWRLCVHDLTTGDTSWIRRLKASYIEGLVSSPGTPSWSADGQWILFASEEDGNRDIYRIRPDGSDLQNLTSDWPGTELMPTWRR
jgi:serine/threonine protein kinase/WD40 repeat protein